METVIGFLLSLLLVIFGAALLGWLLHAWWRGRIDCAGLIPGARGGGGHSSGDGEVRSRLQSELNAARDEAEALRLRLWSLESQGKGGAAPAALADTAPDDDAMTGDALSQSAARIASLEAALAAARAEPVTLLAPAPVMTTEYVPASAAAHARIDELEAALEAAEGTGTRLAELETEFGASQRRIAELREALEAAEGRAAAGEASAARLVDLETGAEDAAGRLASLEAERDAARAEAREAGARIAALQGGEDSAQQRIAELQAALEAAQGRVADGEASASRLVDLEKGSESAAARIADLEAALAAARSQPVVLSAPAPVMTTEYVPVAHPAGGDDDAADASSDPAQTDDAGRIAALEAALARTREERQAGASPAPLVTTEYVPVMRAAPAAAQGRDDDVARLREEARRLRLRLWEVTSGREGAGAREDIIAATTEPLSPQSADEEPAPTRAEPRQAGPRQAGPREAEAQEDAGPVSPARAAPVDALILPEEPSPAEVEAARFLASDDLPDAGYRPAGLLSAPGEDGADDLKRIRGVGAAYETGMNEIGVYHYRQLSALGGRDLAWLDRHLGAKGASIEGRWPSQAAELERLRRLAQPLPPAPGSAQTLDIPSEFSAIEREALRLIETDAIDETRRPVSLLDEPRAGGADDLKEIRGIAYKLEAVLNGVGVFHFDQIATMNAQDIAWLDKRLKFRGRIIRDRWVAQAAMLHRRHHGEAEAGGD